MKTILKYLWIFQERETPYIGGRERIQRRLNPYNPLTYLMYVIIVIISLIWFGIYNTYKETLTDLYKELKWN